MKYKNNINIYAYTTLFKFKSRWKRVLREWGLGLTLGFKRLIFYAHKNLWHFELKKNTLKYFFYRKMCGLFTCIPILGIFIFPTKRKKCITEWWVWICYKAVPNESISLYGPIAHLKMNWKLSIVSNKKEINLFVLKTARRK